jgi:shikimate kinase
VKLIVIHGPPAVGKFTVARELSNLTGYPLLHNHLFFDFASELFEPFTPPFRAMLQELRLLAVRGLAEAGTSGAVLTICYDHPADLELIQGVAAAVAAEGGTTVTVHLVCDMDELRRRVMSPGRREFRKVADPEELDSVLARWNLYEAIPGLPSIRIDNTHLPPDSAAAEIVRHYGLSSA